MDQSQGYYLPTHSNEPRAITRGNVETTVASSGEYHSTNTGLLAWHCIPRGGGRAVCLFCPGRLGGDHATMFSHQSNQSLYCHTLQGHS